MKFNYQARSKEGEIQSGVVEASSREAAFRVLEKHGLYVTALETTGAAPIYSRKLKIFEIITTKDVVLFSRQLSIMLKSKVPLIETFQTIAKQTRKSTFREELLKIAENVEGGTPLSKALAVYPRQFSTFYVSMVRSGEASGKLTDVFDYLADYLEKQYAFRGKIKGAMVYPLLILFVFIMVVGIIMVYVIPQLSSVLTETGQELPFLTKIVIGASGFLKKRGIFVLVAGAGLIIALVFFARSEDGKKFFDKYLLKTPLIKGFLKKLYLGRFALNLSTLISGGLPIIQALDITGEVVGSNTYQKIIIETRDKVKKGETMSSVLERRPNFISPLFYQMVMVGEKTGTLDSSLKNVVQFYQQDIDRGLDSFIKLLEPVFIIALGGVVALLMGAVLMPLYSIGI